jgi:hypothetical protein
MELDLFAADENAITIDDIFAAYHDCRKHKRSRTGALQFEIDLEKNLVELWREITNGTWKPGPSTVFIVNKPVTREIFAASFRDRIVHHLVISRLNHLFEKSFIYDSYSCRTGKGTHFGINRIHRFGRRWSQNGAVRAWVLKIDIRGYFMHINRDILFSKLVSFIDNKYHRGDKEQIKELCRLMAKLGLTLHPKKIYLQPCSQGVKFLGCFIKPSHIVIHHQTIKNFTRSVSVHNALAADHKPGKKEVAAFISSVNSYLGIMKHYRTYRKREAVLNKTISPLWYKHIELVPGYCKITKRRSS